MIDPHYLDTLAAARSINALRGLIDEFIQDTPGVTSFSYLISQYVERPAKPQAITHYPASWVKLYQQKHYAAIDPVVQDILTQRLPFVWNYALYLPRLNEQQAELFINSAQNGVTGGITCPLHGAAGEFGGVFFALDSVQAFTAHHYAVNQWDLMSLALIYHETARRLLIQQCPRTKRLTPREAECLLWSSQGKTAFEISLILGLSMQTVETYLKSCLFKLEARNKTQAVTKAMLQGDLVYQSIDWSKAQLKLN